MLKKEAQKRNQELRKSIQERLESKWNLIGWQVMDVQDYHSALDGHTDTIYTFKNIGFTNIFFSVVFNYRIMQYFPYVGWCDTMPVPYVDYGQLLVLTTSPMENLLKEVDAKEFKESYMKVIVGLLMKRFIPKKYFANNPKQDNEFDEVIDDCTEVAMIYWRLLLERRFNLPKEEIDKLLST